jgi:spermidine synthase
VLRAHLARVTRSSQGAAVRFEELAARQTRLGLLSLRRRFESTVGEDVFEVKLGDEYLMSSLFTTAEEELARLGLAACERTEDLQVIVGGLGLGYTALAALEDPRVGRLTVIDALEDVIDWHREERLPDTLGMAADSRVRLVLGDFFALARSGGLGSAGDDDEPATPLDAILVDIDHSTRHHLDPSHSDLYTPAGLARLAAALRAGGVFALWSDDPPDAQFVADLAAVFAVTAAHEVRFANRLTGASATNTVYVAVTAGA